MTEMYLTPNKYSRPQTKLKAVKGIVIHWYANPNSTALQNRNFFENRKLGKSSFGSAHDLIGLNGEIINAVPYDEVAYHVGSHVYTSSALRNLSSYPNNCVIGIECAHIDWNGNMTDATYNALIKHTANLCKKFNLTEKDVWTHQQVVGWKNCHKLFVDNPSKWVKFIQEVGLEIKGVKPASIPTPKPVDNKDLEMPPVWNDLVLKPNQIGMIEILKPINLWKRDENNKLTKERVLQPGDKYRVYGYDNLYEGQYGLGSGLWVTKIEGYVKYTTPSKSKLEEAENFYSKYKK